jgi:flagellar hook-length control protein FliK
MSENFQPLKIQTEAKAAVEQSANPNSVNAGIPVKPPQEVLEFKSAPLKSEILPIHELGNQISQIDGDNKDSGFLLSQDQMGQNLARLENTVPSSEAAQRNLMSQTLNQIVQKAVLSLHNGQHEVQLHLKPEFLGHIQMQIVSEGQQVAIKMVAEFPFVKEILENNLHQLKADLQSQGLDVDELEVSVAHDSHAEGDVHQNAEAAKLQAGKTGADSDDESSEASGQTQSRDGSPMAETVIDYFA